MRPSFPIRQPHVGSLDINALDSITAVHPPFPITHPAIRQPSLGLELDAVIANRQLQEQKYPEKGNPAMKHHLFSQPDWHMQESQRSFHQSGIDDSAAASKEAALWHRTMAASAMGNPSRVLGDGSAQNQARIAERRLYEYTQSAAALESELAALQQQIIPLEYQNSVWRQQAQQSQGQFESLSEQASIRADEVVRRQKLTHDLQCTLKDEMPVFTQQKLDAAAHLQNLQNQMHKDFMLLQQCIVRSQENVERLQAEMSKHLENAAKLREEVSKLREALREKHEDSRLLGSEIRKLEMEMEDRHVTEEVWLVEAHKDALKKKAALQDVDIRKLRARLRAKPLEMQKLRTVLKSSILQSHPAVAAYLEPLLKGLGIKK
eukprot:gnl/MRDRNA2_/MRDRNA2_148626_c0_seq1.p1 gnl/MRDRNA2_/MRDRNA2_148626_c0~~gnl/MRDRNA2_/MRDRNA2_148626_c0_seq1.p1  ORF type:complete len:377 (+),score=101.65 gnl/MRDRNA2_/MRDRNA2_148626_c0_seq1:155-1285(+)